MARKDDSMEKFIDQRIENCEFWRSQLTELTLMLSKAQSMLMELQVKLEKAESEAKAVRQRGGIRILD